MSVFPPELAVFLLATFPVTELRAALPIALTVFDFSIMEAYPLVILGNLVPMLLVFALLPPVMRFLESRSSYLHHLLNTHLRKLEKKHKERFQRYGSLALFLFVLVPLPGSGVWTGSVLAVLFGLKAKRAVPMIIAGVMAAGLIVWQITNGVLSAWNFLI